MPSKQVPWGLLSPLSLTQVYGNRENSTRGDMLRNTALAYAEQGVPVFPAYSIDKAGVCTCGGTEVNPKCSPGKHPRTQSGLKEATTDLERITAWWERWPEANVAIPTGQASRIFVIDFDDYKPGAMTVAEFEKEYGTVSHTATVRTGSGGLQLYLLYPDRLEIRNSAGRLGPHVDTRGEGGYVIAPPSTTTGRYEWINEAPLEHVPPKLLKTLTSKPRRSPGASGGGASRLKTEVMDGGPIHEGTRDETLTRIAGRLHDSTRDLPQLEDDLLAVNEARCNPPLPAGQVLKIARSIYRYEPCRPSHRETNPETAPALTQAESIILAREWRGKGGKTKYSIAVAWLKLARQYGKRVEDGVKLEVSYSQLANTASTSRPTAMQGIKHMTDLFRVESEGAESGKSGAIVFLLPPAPIFTTLPTERGFEEGCKDSRAPFTAPRLRWSSPARKSRRGTTPGTSKVRDSFSKKRDAVVRLGKSCERVMDVLEAAGGYMTLADLAAELQVRRPREISRRKNLETGKGRDGFVTRLEDVGVLQVVEGAVSLSEDWLEALDRERQSAGEIADHERDRKNYAERSRRFAILREVRKLHRAGMSLEEISASLDAGIEDVRHCLRLKRAADPPPVPDGYVEDLEPVEPVPEPEPVEVQPEVEVWRDVFEPPELTSEDLADLEAIQAFEREYGRGSFHWDRASCKRLFYTGPIKGRWPDQDRLQLLKEYAECTREGVAA